ncbi:hypothetical protein GGR50DRAFT_644648 [Xylaria sp. CBS 124048]|nr:hypothetical protein GGR50DRAFT_644648 [Xylaria sp. CBS 124048]
MFSVFFSSARDSFQLSFSSLTRTRTETRIRHEGIPGETRIRRHTYRGENLKRAIKQPLVVAPSLLSNKEKEKKKKEKRKGSFVKHCNALLPFSELSDCFFFFFFFFFLALAAPPSSIDRTDLDLDRITSSTGRQTAFFSYYFVCPLSILSILSSYLSYLASYIFFGAPNQLN